MIFTKRRMLILIVVALVTLLSLSARMSGFFGVYGDYTTTEQELFYGGRANLDYRTLVGDTGYLRFSSYADLLYNPELDEFSDTFSAAIENSWFIAEDELSIILGSQFSFLKDPYWSPDWELAYRLYRGRRAINPILSYSGYLTDTQVVNGIKIGIEHTPAIEFSYALSLEGALDTNRDLVQTDILTTLTWNLSALVGYSMNWRLDGDATYRISQDSATEGYFGQVRGGYTYTASHSLQLYIAPFWSWSYLIESATSDHAVGVTTRADLTIAERFYLYGEPSITIENLQDSATRAWNTQITIGLDVGI